MKKSNISILGKAVLWLLIWAVAGYLLLVAAYSLPVDKMRSHLESTTETFRNGNVDLIKDDVATSLDYLTEPLILAEAVYNGSESAFVKAAAIYSADASANGEETWSYRKITNALAPDNEATRVPYSRYWQGELAILKPLLLFFDYKDILRLNLLVQLLLMFAMVQLAAQKQLKLLLPLVLLFGALTPATTAMCLQYTPCFLVMGAGCVFLLRRTDAVQRAPWLFFLSLGMATSYFDFLTYPLVTLCVPLVFWLLLTPADWKAQLWKIIKESFWWGVGYIGFWAEKWLLGSLVLRENVFANAWTSIQLRSSHETVGEHITYLATLKNNLQAYSLRTWQVLGLVLVVGALVLAVRRRTLTRSRLLAVLPLAVIACMPFVWYFFTQNHSYIHYGFTHKELAITIFAGACVLCGLCRKEDTPPAAHL